MVMVHLFLPRPLGSLKMQRGERKGEGGIWGWWKTTELAQNLPSVSFSLVVEAVVSTGIFHF